MAAAPLTPKSVMKCPHGGIVSVPKPKNATGPLTVGDTFLVKNCPYILNAGAPIPMPCLTVTWTKFSQAKSNGQPIVDQQSQGVCLNAQQTPQGSVVIVKV